jgi:hypothetical protein
MSKKHFIEIAAELNAALEISRAEGKAAENATLRAIEGLATVFAGFNPQFDRARFLRACGV